jgi:hypothetical protein
MPFRNHETFRAGLRLLTLGMRGRKPGRYPVQSTWHYDRTDKDYTLMPGDSHCRVWKTQTGRWGGMVTYRGYAHASYNFNTAEEAKDWCEDEVSK